MLGKVYRELMLLGFVSLSLILSKARLGLPILELVGSPRTHGAVWKTATTSCDTHSAAVELRARAAQRSRETVSLVLGSWAGARRPFHLSLFLAAPRMVLFQDPSTDRHLHGF